MLHGLSSLYIDWCLKIRSRPSSVTTRSSNHIFLQVPRSRNLWVREPSVYLHQSYGIVFQMLQAWTLWKLTEIIFIPILTCLFLFCIVLFYFFFFVFIVIFIYLCLCIVFCALHLLEKALNKCQYCIVLYCIALYCIVLYCIVLYCIVLYCIVLCCMFSSHPSLWKSQASLK